MIFRLRDTDDDDVADQQETIIRLETAGNYPHNGLAGLAFDGEGRLYFGMGENLGMDWRMLGSDGTTQRGSGEGGVFRCDPTGRDLTRVATGFWNPFGITIDSTGRIFAVGNDADGRPPSRLVQVVETGDYGFQYRYGRSGIHPLQAWDGELPGTLPMVTGTGEAPCELIVYQGRLITGSWGDFRVERYELVPVGASFQARRDIVVQGNDQFRPVAFAEAPDGSLYFTDWVDKSYPVHGKGRIWRLSWKQLPARQSMPPLSAAERQARAALEWVDHEALGSTDRFLRQHAIAGLVRSSRDSQSLRDISLQEVADPRRRLSLLQALRWKTDHALVQPEPAPLDHLRDALADADPDVRLLAVRWVADARIRSLRPLVARQLESFKNTTPALFQASVAALEYLDTGATTFDPQNIHRYFVDALTSQSVNDELRLMALRMVPAGEIGQSLPLSTLRELIALGNRTIQREAVRTLAFSTLPEKSAWLQSLAGDVSVDVEAMKDFQLIAGSTPPGPARQTPPLQPAVNDMAAWMQAVGRGGDPDEGWRVFFAPGRLNCAACHQFQGRGSKTGPDLTGIAKRTSRQDVLESILYPSRQVAPRYVPVVMELEDGRVRNGLWIGHDSQGQKELFQDPSGNLFAVDPGQIRQRRPVAGSVMPGDLHEQYSLREIRNLLALLEAE
jgi:putative heme-binding domain-containing protein